MQLLGLVVDIDLHNWFHSLLPTSTFLAISARCIEEKKNEDEDNYEKNYSFE